jgi:hypothetical protein
MPDENEQAGEKLTTIVLAADDSTSRFGNTVPVPVNGKVSHLTVGEPTPVGEHIMSALDGAGIRYTVQDSSEDATGASSGGVFDGALPADDTAQKSITPLTDRNTPNGTVQSDVQQGTAGDELETPTELIPTPAPEDSQPNAAGGVTLANGVNSAVGTNADAAEPQEVGQAEGQSEEAATKEPNALDGSIPDLVEYIKTENDPAEIDRLIAGEKAGKSRIGALDALEARKSELAAAE